MRLALTCKCGYKFTEDDTHCRDCGRSLFEGAVQPDEQMWQEYKSTLREYKKKVGEIEPDNTPEKDPSKVWPWMVLWFLSIVLNIVQYYI